ncbi:MAG: hypothetical protein RIF32_04610 [Leptospirales bacterium]|jgi:hypothetical protein
MEDTEKIELRRQLSGNYALEEESDFWIVARKADGQVVATVLLSEPYQSVCRQLNQAGVA